MYRSSGCPWLMRPLPSRGTTGSQYRADSGAPLTPPHWPPSRSRRPWRRASGWSIVCDLGAARRASGRPRTNRTAMSQLNAKKRSQLPKSAFAYVDSKGRRRLPINDEPHVRNALARFNQVAFEDDAARERARKRLLSAAKKYGIVPIGFMTGQLRSQMSEAAAGRFVIELGQVDTPSEFERRLPTALRDPSLPGLHSPASAARCYHRGCHPAARRAEAARRRRGCELRGGDVQPRRRGRRGVRALGRAQPPRPTGVRGPLLLPALDADRRHARPG